MGKTQSTSSNTASKTKQKVPGYVTDTATAVANKAQDVAAQPYTPYTGELTAGNTADQQSAFQNVRDLVANAPNITPEVTGDISTYAGAPAQSVSTERAVDTTGKLGSMADYMDPNIAATLVPAIRAIQEQADAQRKQIGATATMSGAFGDARQGVNESTLGRNTETAIGDTTANAYEKAYQDAMARREQDLSRFNAQDNTNANYNETALNRKLGGANALEGSTTQDQQNLISRLNALLSGGTMQQQTAQAGDITKLQEFLRGQGWDASQLATLSPALNAVSNAAPKDTKSTGTSTQTAPDNSLYQLGGALLGAFL